MNSRDTLGSLGRRFEHDRTGGGMSRGYGRRAGEGRRDDRRQGRCGCDGQREAGERRKKGVMLFTDMFGGTPSNIALAFLGESIEVVTGVNLSMLIKFANHREEKSLPELARLVQEAAQKSIVIASQMLKGKK
jgi:hypothetical protein